MGVEHRYSRRHFLVGLVMVCHHHVHTKSSCQCDFFVRGRATIGGHQERNAFVMQALHGIEVEPIAFA